MMFRVSILTVVSLRVKLGAAAGCKSGFEGNCPGKGKVQACDEVDHFVHSRQTRRRTGKDDARFHKCPDYPYPTQMLPSPP